jgi:hemerythrin-like domain-containing protein
MQRYNVFLLVHKGLRAMMYDTSLSLQHTDFGAATDHPHALEKLVTTIDNFDAHAHHEDRFVLSLLESCAPGLLNEMESEHAADHALSEELRKLVAIFQTSSTSAEKAAIGTRICYTFNEFIAFNLRHLNKEEIVVNEVLWNNYSDIEIIQANQRLVSSLSPDDARLNAMWMIRSCSNSEIIGWINAIKNNIPAPTFQLLMQLVEQELPEQRFEAVQSGILEAA